MKSSGLKAVMDRMAPKRSFDVQKMKQRDWDRAEKISRDQSLCCIYMIENHFRPWYFRLAEYFIAFVTVLWGRVTGRPVRSWTIGPCQLGLPAILTYYRKCVAADQGAASMSDHSAEEKAAAAPSNAVPDHEIHAQKTTIRTSSSRTSHETSAQKTQPRPFSTVPYNEIHARTVKIRSFREIRQIFSVISLKKSLEILGWRLSAAAEKAEKRWPDNRKLQIRAAGTEFGGRLTYGLMAERVWKRFADEAVTQAERQPDGSDS